MLETTIAILVFLVVISGGWVFLSLSAERKRRLEDRLGEQHTPTDMQKGHSSLSRAMEQIGRHVAPKEVSRSLAEKLSHAGYHGQSAATVYMGAKMVLLVAALIVGVAGVAYLPLSISLKIALLLLVVGLLFFLPNIVVDMRRRERISKIREHLPNAVDLLEVCVSSGMGLDMAWNVVADEIRRVAPALSDEMALTSLEINLGASRADAMRHMAERTKVDEIGSLVTMLVQAERFGTSIAEALQTMAGSMRDQRSFVAQEKSEKTAVKLLLPMLLFIFPAVIIVMVGPAGIRLYNVMFGGN